MPDVIPDISTPEPSVPTSDLSTVLPTPPEAAATSMPPPPAPFPLTPVQMVTPVQVVKATPVPLPINPYVETPPQESLDPRIIAEIQRHAKYAISALNYDDLETARKELTLALSRLTDCINGQ